MRLSLKLHLPFKLPMKDEQKFISEYYHGDVSCHFSTYTKEVKFDNDEVPMIYECTLITLYFLPKGELYSGYEVNQLLRETVMFSIFHVNKLIDAIRTSFGLDYLYNITIYNFPETMEIAVDDKMYLYVTKPQEILRQDFTINKEGMSKVGTTLSTWDKYPEQFLVDKFFDSARSHLYREQLIDAVIDLQTSFEIFIRTTHKLVLVKNEVSEDEIKKASNFAFRNVIEHHLSKHLNVNLTFNEQGPINEWYENLYLIRNEIVHQGRNEITGERAYRAYDVYVNARNFISDKLSDIGYLNKDNKVDLRVFKKNTKENHDIEVVVKRLKEQGVIDKDLKFERPDKTEQTENDTSYNRACHAAGNKPPWAARGIFEEARLADSPHRLR